MNNITSNEIANYLGEKFSNISNFKEMLASGENTLLLHKDNNLNIRLRWIGEKKQKSKNVIASLTINQDDLLTNLDKAVKLIQDGRFIVEVYEKNEDGAKRVQRFSPEKQKAKAKQILLPQFQNSFVFLKDEELKTIRSSVESAAKATHTSQEAPPEIPVEEKPSKQNMKAAPIQEEEENEQAAEEDVLAIDDSAEQELTNENENEIEESAT